MRCCRINLPNRCYHLISRVAHRAFEGRQAANRKGRAAMTRKTYCGNLLWQSSLLAPRGLIGEKRMKDWNHILKISMHMKVLAICFLFCGLAGCSSRTNPYAFTYKKNFVGLNRDEALAELVSIRLVLEGQRDEEETDFQFKCYIFKFRCPTRRSMN